MEDEGLYRRLDKTRSNLSLPEPIALLNRYPPEPMANVGNDKGYTTQAQQLINLSAAQCTHLRGRKFPLLVPQVN